MLRADDKSAFPIRHGAADSRTFKLGVTKSRKACSFSAKYPPDVRTRLIGRQRPRSVAAQPAPFAWTMALLSRESSREMALVDKPTSEGNVCEWHATFAQQTLRSFNPPMRQPLMWRHADGLPKRSAEVAG